MRQRGKLINMNLEENLKDWVTFYEEWVPVHLVEDDPTKHYKPQFSDFMNWMARKNKSTEKYNPKPTDTYSTNQ